MAEVLSDANDEILFVDYNTADDFPTFPEAIADTLTEKAKRHLRILRVRPSIHDRFASRTHLVAIEPIARNVAVRRSNPANRWILSTNTDMIFIPRVRTSLSEIVCELPKSYYGAPRFEVPEALWEGFDRLDPQRIINTIDRWGWDFHLNEIVGGLKPFLFDGPGDFQLIERSDLFAIHGFHEDMLLGWHVDANIAKRLSLIYGDAKDLSASVFGYHCDHTRQVTPAHRSDAPQNDSSRFFFDVKRPDVPEQAEIWGCNADEIEEIKITKSSGYLKSLERFSPSRMSAPRYVEYIPETFNNVEYSPYHVLPFLLDIFASVPRDWQVGWVGAPGLMFSLFAEGWRNLNFSKPIMLDRSLGKGIPESQSIRLCSITEIANNANAFVLDFSYGDGLPLDAFSPKSLKLNIAIINAFQALVAAEEGWGGQRAPRRFVGINAVHNQFERVFAARVNCAKTPFSVRIRHGFLFKADVEDPCEIKRESVAEDMFDFSLSETFPSAEVRIGENLVHYLRLGPAGRKHSSVIHTRSGVAGLVAQTVPLLIHFESAYVELECRSVKLRKPQVSRFGFLRIEMAARARRALGHSFERRIARFGSRILGKSLSSWFRTCLRKWFTSDALLKASKITAPNLRLSIHQGRHLLGSEQVVRGNITTTILKRVVEFSAKTDAEQHRKRKIVLSFSSKGGESVEIVSVRLLSEKH